MAVALLFHAVDDGRKKWERIIGVITLSRLPNEKPKHNDVLSCGELKNAWHRAGSALPGVPVVIQILL